MDTNYDRGFVGRAEELQRVEQACAAACRGQGTLLVVSGESGMGRSRFCTEAAHRAKDVGLRAVVAACEPERGAPPLGPWPAILTDLCGERTLDLLSSQADSPAKHDRLARFTQVIEHLAQTCTVAPAFLAIDDVDTADPGTLLLVGLLVRSLPRMPLVLVLVVTRQPDRDARATRLLQEIEQAGTQVRLNGFDEAETTSFLATHGFRPLDQGIVSTLFRVTSGHPLALRRVIETTGPPDPDMRRPKQPHVTSHLAMPGLSGHTKRVLAEAAVLGREVQVAEVATLTGHDTTAMAEAIEEATTAGMVVQQGPEAFAFTHQLVRVAFQEALDPRDRLDTHARAAALLAREGGDASTDRLSRAAHHAQIAAHRSPADGPRAVTLCRAAARLMVASFAYEQADALLTAAVNIHETAHLGPPPGQLLVDWAQVALLCGDTAEARGRFDRAATWAGHNDDLKVAAEAALGLSGMWLNSHRLPAERERVLCMQRAALASLRDGHEVLRIRLQARLATEAFFDGGPLQPVEDALAAARASGDLQALAEVLSLTHHALLWPTYIRWRVALADELVEVASRTGHSLLTLTGLLWRTVDLLHLGDNGALRALEDLRERANALGQQNIQYIVAVIDVMLLIRTGRLDDAEAAAWECYAMGEAIGEAHTFGVLGTQLLAIRWMQGYDGDIIDAVEQAATTPAMRNAEFSLWASAAVIAARAGDTDRAYAALDRLTSGELRGAPQTNIWLAGMVALVEAAAVLDDPSVAGTAYDQMLPFADLPVITSVGVICLGSTERSLGIAASVLGKHHDAVEHLERALVTNRRLGNRTLVTITCADLAWALRRRDGSGDRAQAEALLVQAIADATTMQLATRIAAWQGELAALRTDRHEPQARSEWDDTDHRHRLAPDDPTVQRSGLVRAEDGRWVIELDDRRVRVPNLVGMTYLVELLTHPGQAIPALTLAAGADMPGGDQQAVLDEDARRAYMDRARELSDDLAEAEAVNDARRAERIRAELDALVDAVEAATGFNGRIRQFSNESERARTAVRKAIKRALDAIEDAEPRIAQVLRSSILTGISCMYSPDAHDPIAWSTTNL